MALKLSLGFFLCLLSFASIQTVLAQEGKPQTQSAASSPAYEYRLLATMKTSTMEKELNQNAQDGFRFAGVMGGETAFGGNESVVVMSRVPSDGERYEYKLLATNKTSTMEKELRQAGNNGFEIRGKTVFETAFGGKEVVVILERPKLEKAAPVEYKLLATSKTSTMQKELTEAGREGFQFVVMAVAETAFGGREVVVVLRRPGRMPL